MVYLYSQFSLIITAIMCTLGAMAADLFVRWNAPPSELTMATQSTSQYIFSSNTVIFYLFAIQIVGMCGIFLTPLSTLVYVQTFNFIKGMTTNERFSKRKLKTMEAEGVQCLQMCREGGSDEQRKLYEDELRRLSFKAKQSSL